MPSKVSGSERCSHDNLEIVSAATGTVPHALDHGSGPPSCLISQLASGADSVSFQSLAGRTGAPSAAQATSPCCWAATEIPATEGDPASAHAASNAAHQAP